MFQIPEEKLPDCLKDEKRINVLFAPLRSRSVNAKEWEYKINSWKTIIKTYCDCNDVYSFTLSSLNKVFIRNGRPPHCMNEVIAELLRDQEIQVIEVFLKRCADTWTGWATDILLKRPLAWSYNKIKNSIFTASNQDGPYAHIDVIKIKCEDLIAAVPNKHKNKLISLGDLLSVLGKTAEKAQNIKLLLHYLLVQYKVDVTKLDSTKGNDELKTFLIKFGDGQQVSPISEIDIGIYTLEINEEHISKNVESLEDEIQACIKDAKLQLSKNHRQMAKSLLRKKHELEKRLEKKATTLHNIQILLEKIHDTHSDAHVWEAYKNALAAFNTTFKDTGLSEDAVEDTMLQLGDVLEKHDDIQAALARPALDTNDLDLEEELAELLKGEAGDQPPPDDSGITSDLEKHMEKLCLDLPQVPSKSPNVTVEEVSLNN